MNCDQVFDVLTRGPFPTGTDCDEPVEEHLSQCRECRRLAEALRPALELFQEAVDPEESRELPGYWSAVAIDRSRAPSSPARIEPRGVLAERAEAPSAVERYWTSLAAWRMVAMVALGVTLGTLASARLAFDDDALPRYRIGAPSLAPLADKPRANLADRVQWAALPVACFRPSADDERPRERLLANVGPSAAQCCSRCHHALGTTPASATASVAQSCQVCHQATAELVPVP